uniref:MAM domain-containing protein n=1 Tax=Xiphophorus couchianus TaxID=32473 RepID=A0A3B5LCJ1_9TELE
MYIYIISAVRAHSRLLPGSCNFESNTCGYTSDADFSIWTLNRDGTFIPYCISMGVLLSPSLEHDEWSCVRLVYQIAGSGHLEVLRRSEGRSFDTPLWSSRTPSDSWVIASVDLHNASDFCPNCRFISVLLSPECDFEEPHLCGYNNQWNVNVNWYVGGGGLQLVCSSSSGHFMYVDSSYAKTFTEVAKLVSPMATTPMSGCLSFQYQRSEERGNMFTVFTRDRLGQYQELWKAEPDNRVDFISPPGEWIPVQVDLKAPHPVQVVFEVGFNSPRGGHVALDDISFSPEFCNKDTEPTFDPSVANCDFESGLCLYTQDRSAASSWRRVSVKPNIFRNGDHTTGAGSFLLAHSRLGPRSGYVSSVISPILPGNTRFCLRFYFSLRGDPTPALVVYLLQQGGRQENIWTQAEKSRGIWISADVSFQTSQPAKMAFVSTCRSFWDCGSVALDDVSLNLGDCELTAGFLSAPLPGHCDFEAGLCGYSQDKHRDAAAWHQRRGPTPTSYTGPRGDHTTGLGYYMYIEASPMLPGQSARLRSRPVRGTRGPQCLRFFYHMYGSGTGKLRVLADKDGEEVLLWQRSGEQSIAWLRAQLEYQSQSHHQIVFEATRGSSVRSDIAIDDIMLDSGPCPGDPLPLNYIK